MKVANLIWVFLKSRIPRLGCILSHGHSWLGSLGVPHDLGNLHIIHISQRFCYKPGRNTSSQLVQLIFFPRIAGCPQHSTGGMVLKRTVTLQYQCDLRLRVEKRNRIAANSVVLRCYVHSINPSWIDPRICSQIWLLFSFFQKFSCPFHQSLLSFFKLIAFRSCEPPQATCSLQLTLTTQRNSFCRCLRR